MTSIAHSTILIGQVSIPAWAPPWGQQCSLGTRLSCTSRESRSGTETNNSVGTCPDPSSLPVKGSCSETRDYSPKQTTHKYVVHSCAVCPVSSALPPTVPWSAFPLVETPSRNRTSMSAYTPRCRLLWGRGGELRRRRAAWTSICRETSFTSSPEVRGRNKVKKIVNPFQTKFMNWSIQHTSCMCWSVAGLKVLRLMPRLKDCANQVCYHFISTCMSTALTGSL